MSRRRRPQKLVTGFYGQETPEPQLGLPVRPCYRCGRRCVPYRYATTLICSACRWLAVYGRTEPT